MELKIKTKPDEFWKFHKIITRGTDYAPYYILLEKEGKEPKAGINWKKNRKTFTDAYNWMKRGYNIGIAATDKDNLCIVDVDDMSQVPEIKETLQVTSRKRIGRHNFFFATDRTAKKNIATGDAGEVRSNWQYVLAAGSFVPCGEKEFSRMPEEEKQFAGLYTLRNERKPSEITFNELPDVYKRRYEEKKKGEFKAIISDLERKPKQKKNTNSRSSALFELSITDVSGISDTRGKRIAMPSEIHGSETGHNCSVSNGVLHCWRHEISHSPLSYLAILSGVSTCERAGKQHGGRSLNIDTHNGETLFKLWTYAKSRKMIPHDDPIPYAALVYYALEKGTCRKEDLGEGWKLPKIVEVVTKHVAKKEGLNFGN